MNDKVKDKKQFYISSSPHFSANLTTTKIMACVLIALLPEVIFGIVSFGLPAFVTILVSVIGAVGFEALYQIITKQKVVVSNLSAAVTGVMLALVLPSTTPVWMVLLADLVAVVVAKGLFGGIGSNVFNPALTGRAVLFISFPAAIGATWATPLPLLKQNPSLDAISSATVLSQINSGTFAVSGDSIWQLFMGNRAGCIGETFILGIIISFVFLLMSRIIDWRAPLAMVGTVCVCAFISGLVSTKTLAGAGTEVLLYLLSGGLLFGATFMVKDYATTPITKPGRLIFGFGCGIITFLIRRFGNYPEGVMFSILIMNAVAPLLNNFTSRMYGYKK